MTMLAQVKYYRARLFNYNHYIRKVIKDERLDAETIIDP